MLAKAKQIKHSNCFQFLGLKHAQNNKKEFNHHYKSLFDWSLAIDRDVGIRWVW